MNPDTLHPDEYQRLFPEHAKTKLVWEKSQAIANFTDFLRSQGVELCGKHVHVDACYGPLQPVREPYGPTWREIPGVSARPLLCGYQTSQVFRPIGDQLTAYTAKYFGIDLAAYDLEEVELKKLRAFDFRAGGPYA